MWVFGWKKATCMQMQQNVRMIASVPLENMEHCEVEEYVNDDPWWYDDDWWQLYAEGAKTLWGKDAGEEKTVSGYCHSVETAIMALNNKRCCFAIQALVFPAMQANNYLVFGYSPDIRSRKEMYGRIFNHEKEWLRFLSQRTLTKWIKTFYVIDLDVSELPSKYLTDADVRCFFACREHICTPLATQEVHLVKELFPMSEIKGLLFHTGWRKAKAGYSTFHVTVCNVEL
jgi:hypothetical protein